MISGAGSSTVAGRELVWGAGDFFVLPPPARPSTGPRPTPPSTGSPTSRSCATSGGSTGPRFDITHFPGRGHRGAGRDRGVAPRHRPQPAGRPAQHRAERPDPDRHPRAVGDVREAPGRRAATPHVTSRWPSTRSARGAWPLHVGGRTSTSTARSSTRSASTGSPLAFVMRPGPWTPTTTSRACGVDHPIQDAGLHIYLRRSIRSLPRPARPLPSHRRPDSVGTCPRAADERLWQGSPTKNDERFEVQRIIPAEPAEVFAVVSNPQGHVAIDASGMLSRDRRARGRRRRLRDPHGPRGAQRLPARPLRRHRPLRHVRAGP